MRNPKFEAKSFALNPNLFLTASLVLYLIGVGASYAKSVQGDFSIYFEAGQRAKMSQPIYDYEQNLYVYGPLLANLLALLPSHDEILVSRLWLIASIIAVVSACLIYCRFYLSTVDADKILLVCCLVTIGFGFRNNIGNGSVMAFVAFGFVSIVCLNLRQQSLFKALLVAIILLIIFEVKTYIAIFAILHCILLKRLLTITLFILIMFTSNFIYTLRETGNYLDWFKSLLIRSESIETGSDQSTILYFANAVTPNQTIFAITLAVFGYSLLFLYCSRIALKLKSDPFNLGLVLMSAAPVLTIFAHGQDFILSSIVMAHFIASGKTNENSLNKFYVVLQVALLINWTSEGYTKAIMVILFLLLVLIMVSSLEGLVVHLGIGLGALITFYLAVLLKVDWHVQFVSYNFFALIFGITTLLNTLYAFQQKDRTN